MSDRTLTMSLLFDFFGDLLPEKQREYFDLYYNDDLSLSEIAEITGISRQGVRDGLKKAEASLREYEEKTGVVARFDELRRKVLLVEADARRLTELTDGEALELSRSIAGGLDRLKG